MKNFNFGANLRMVRLYKGISQEEMAKDLVISQSTYSRIESNKDLPEIKMINKLAEIMKVRPRDLVTVGWYAEEVSGHAEEIMSSAAILNRTGQITYIILIAVAAWDSIFGFAGGWGQQSTDALLGIGGMFGIGAFFLHYFTVKRVDVIIKNGQLPTKYLL